MKLRSYYCGSVDSVRAAWEARLQANVSIADFMREVRVADNAWREYLELQP